MNQRLKYVLINILTVIAILAIVEVSCRVVLYKIYNRGFDSSLIVENKYFNSPGLKENASGVVWGKAFHTDEYGGRKNAIHDNRKKKWLFIGDSVTEGVGVEDSSTFSSLCSEEIPEMNVLNYSLIGYSAFDYLNVLKSVLQNDTSVELVTLFYCLNDVYGNSKTKDLPVMAKQNTIGTINSFLQNRSATYKLIKLFLYRHSDRYFEYDSQFYAKNNPLFTESMNYLLQCDSMCKSRKILFQIVMLPYKSQLTDAGRERVPQDMVKEFCWNHSIEFSDAGDFLANQSDTRSLYLFADEIHFSAKGHKAIAKYLTQ